MIGVSENNGETAAYDGDPAKTSSESDARVQRKNKGRKVAGEFSNEQTLFPREEDWMVDNEDTSAETEDLESKMEDGFGKKEIPKRSYRDAFTHDKGTFDDEEDAGFEEDWWSNERWKERIQVVQTARGPNVLIPEKEKQRLNRKWERSLFVKLMGKVIREDYLLLKLQIWGLHGEQFELIDVGSGYFLVKFRKLDDYEVVLTGGPWMIMDHYLAVQPWKEDFEPDVEQITRIAAWVRISRLPMDYYDKGILYVLGSQIGNVLKVDVPTLKKSKGRFARLCISDKAITSHVTG